MAWPDSLIPAGDWAAGFTSAPTLQQKITDRLNLLVGRIADSGWQALPLASGIVANGTPAPRVRLIGLVVYFEGQVQQTGGTAFAASADVLIVAPGGVPSTMIPTSQVALKPIASNQAGVYGRLALDTDGSLKIRTSPGTTATIYDLSAMSGTLAGA